MGSGEHKGSRGRLYRPEECFRVAFEEAAIGMALAGPDGRFIDVNRAWCRMLGYSRDELLGVHFADITHPDDRQTSLEHARRLLEGEIRGYRLRKRFLRKDGRTMWAQLSVALVRDAAGAPLHMIGQIEDITERVLAEEALERRDAILEAVAAAGERFLRSDASLGESIQGILKDLGQAARVSRVWYFEVYRAEDGTRWANQLAEWALPGLESMGPQWRNFPVGAAGFGRWEEQMTQGRVIHGLVKDFPASERERMEAEGTRSVVGVPIFVGGEVRGIIGFDECRTDREWSAAEIDALSAAGAFLGALVRRRESEESLRRSEECFRNLVESTSDWVWEVDERAVYTYASPQVRRILGYEPEVVVGKTPYEFMPPQEAERVAGVFGPVAAARQPFDRIENVNLHRDGRPVVLETSGVPIFDPGGEFRGYRGIDRDVTERRQAEEALKESERRYRHLFDSLTDAAFVADPDTGVILETNRQAEVLLGRGRQEIVGLHQTGLHPPGKADFYRRQFASHAARGEVGAADGEVLRSDGTVVPVMIRAALATVGGRRVLLGIFRDMTEKVRSEEALRASEQRYRTIFETSRDMIGELSPDGRLRLVNEAAVKVCGLPKEEMLGRPLTDLIHPEDKERVLKVLEEAVRAGRDIADVPARLVTARGEVRHLIWNGRLVRDAEGRVVAIHGSGHDVTDTVRRHEELERSRDEQAAARLHFEALARGEEERANWLGTLLDQVPIGVVIAQAPDGRLVLTNRAAETIWGGQAADAPIEEWGEHWHFVDAEGRPTPGRELPLARCLLEGEVFTAQEITLVRADGRKVPLMYNAAPVRDAGRIVGAVVAFWDISEQKETQRRLEEVSRLKDEFLSLASHELRTPITSIKIYSELAARHPEVVRPELMTTLTRQADQLVSLIDDLLDVSRLQLGQMPLELATLDLATLVCEACRRSRPLFSQTLRCCLEETPEVLVRADPRRLEQVVDNLLGNAAKYSPPETEIEVRVGLRRGRALLSVADQGIGIDPEVLPHVFERFYKPRPQQAVYGGLGLGLHICQEIVGRHGGSIWAESEPGRGSTFYVELPLAKGA